MRYFIIIGLFTICLLSCKKQKDTNSNPQNNIPSLLTEGNGWHIELKAEIRNTFVGNIMADPIDIKYLNNAFYATIHGQLLNGNEYDIFQKTENGIASLYDYPRLGTGISYSHLTRNLNGFYFLPNETSEYAFDMNGGSFNFYKDGIQQYSIAQGRDVQPISKLFTYNINYKVKHQINYDPSIPLITALNLPSGKTSRFKVYFSAEAGGIGYNDGSFVWDESYMKNNTNNLKVYYGGLFHFNNYKTYLCITELNDTMYKKNGDPNSTGNFEITKPQDTCYIGDLGGIGFNFGEAKISGFEKDNSVYYFVKLANLKHCDLIEYNKLTHTAQIVNSWPTSGLPADFQWTNLFYRPLHNDIILTGYKIYKFDLNNSSFETITPAVKGNTYTKNMCQVGERIYGIASEMKSFNPNEPYFISNLFYYE